MVSISIFNLTQIVPQSTFEKTVINKITVFEGTSIDMSIGSVLYRSNPHS